MIFSLSTNKIFKNNNLIFENQIKTETNNLIKKKVFFIVFDTLDYEFLFKEKHNLEIINFNKLRSNSIFFTNAFPPASKTLNVIPSLLIGEYPKKFTIDGNFKEISMIDLKGNKINFNYENSIFSDLKNQVNLDNKNFSIIGRYHPLCNIFENINCNNFTANFNNDMKVNWYSGISRFCETIGEIIKYLKIHDICKVSKNRIEKKNKAILNEINYLNKKWESFFSKDVNFNFIHVLAPKPVDYHYGKKFISDQKSFFKNKENIIASHRKYGQNIIYVDELIGRLLKVISNYDDYMLIITGDTSLLEQNQIKSNRVPLIININNNSENLVIQKKFNTVDIKQIILNYYKGNFKNYSDINDILLNHNFNDPILN